MSVLVRIEMRGPQACADNALDLRRQLIIDSDAGDGDIPHELRHRWSKRRFTHQHQVTTHVERRVLLRQTDGVIKGGAGGHQRGGGQDALAMRFDDSLIDIPCKAEVIGVDY